MLSTSRLMRFWCDSNFRLREKNDHHPFGCCLRPSLFVRPCYPIAINIMLRVLQQIAVFPIIRSKSGGAPIGDALMVALVSLAIVSPLTQIGISLNTVFTTIATKLALLH